MTYSSAQIMLLPWPLPCSQPDGSHLVEWDLALEGDLPAEVGAASQALREAALHGFAAVRRAQGSAELSPTEDELSRFQVDVEATGPAALRLRLRLVHGRGNLALGLTAQVWRAIERRFSRIRSIQGLDRSAWARLLGDRP